MLSSALVFPTETRIYWNQQRCKRVRIVSELEYLTYRQRLNMLFILEMRQLRYVMVEV